MNPPTTRARPDPIEDILHRIARVESPGGGYTTRGPVITRGSYRGQRAAGKYQIMPGNLPAWSREALGREVSLDEFLANPELQERIARHRVSALYDEYGNPADVASVWHSGRPLAQAGNARDQNMTTREYVRRVTGPAVISDPELERLERALRAAHAAGDEAAARRLAAALVAQRSVSAAPASPPQMRPAQPILLDEAGQPVEDGEDTLARFRMETGGAASGDTANTIRLRAQYDPAAEGEPTSAGPIGSARAKWERGETLTADEAETLGFASPEKARREWEAEQARLRGRASVRPEEREGLNLGAAAQGVGSGFFGVGTPATAVGEMLVSRMDREPGTSTWGESLAFARGRRDQLRESHPHEFYTGMAGSLVGGVGLARAGRSALPRAASVFSLQSGQTARNIGRLAAAGAGAGGVTALNEEGTGAVAGGAVLGAVAGPALAGAASVVRAPVRAVAGRVNPDNAAIRLLARRLGEPVAALQRRYDEFVQTRGRPPRLAEIVRQATSEEFGQIARTRSEAGAIFRQAEEDAARALPGEMAPLVQAGGVVGSEPAAAARRAATTAQAAEVVGRRVQSSAVRQVGVKGTEDGGQRGRSMDALMGRIGEHRVPITNEMLEVVEDPDLMGALEPAVRRGVRRAIEAAGDGETPYLRVRDWDTIRLELGRHANTENGRRYAQLRNEVRDYVSSAVPEYGAGLREFTRRSRTARGTAEGARILTRSTREFADRLRSAGAAEMTGARVGARTTVASVLSGDAAKAERFMGTLARDAGLRERVRLALRPDEAAELERLAERYGHHLEMSEGMRIGRGILQRKDSAELEEAVAARRTRSAGVRQGARAALTEAAGESPAGAARTALRMAEDPGLQSRIATALGAGEQRRLTTLGRSATESSRRLAEAAPGGTSLAATRAQENAEGIQRVIQAGVVATGRFSGGFLGNFTNAIVQRTRLSRGAARRLAELATDPARAHMAIARLRRAGLEAELVHRMYQDAAVMSGINIGRGTQDIPESAEAAEQDASATIAPVVVRKEQAGTPLTEQLTGLQQSALVQDTAAALLGYRPGVRTETKRYPDTDYAKAEDGAAVFNGAWIRSNGAVPEGYRSVRDIGVHEIGHLFMAENPDVYSALATSFEANKVLNWDKYSASDRREHAATVFMEALNRLQASRDKPALARVLLQRADEAVPGTRSMMEILLRKPIFAQHPLNG